MNVHFNTPCRMHKSVQTNQTGILYSILQIHDRGRTSFDCDPCFNRGSMYGSLIPMPELKFDINPIHQAVTKGNALDLPLKSKSIHSMIIDPPFLISTSEGKMANRYSSFESKETMFNFFKCMISEAYRVLQEDGLFVVKIQDCNHNRRRVFSSHFIRSMAFVTGFNLIDEIILYTQNRISAKSFTSKNCTRSHHCFFLIFRKKRSRTKYPSCPKNPPETLRDKTKKPREYPSSTKVQPSI